MAAVEQERGLAEAHALYDRYVKGLEGEHWGEFVREHVIDIIVPGAPAGWETPS